MSSQNFEFNLQNYCHQYYEKTEEYTIEGNHGRSPYYGKTTRYYDVNGKEINNLPMDLITSPEIKDGKYGKLISTVIMNYDNYLTLLYEVDRHKKELFELKAKLENLKNMMNLRKIKTRKKT